ncbi:hypothetical protein [Arthrobacter sp. AFG20]|uniref:hypothetical protein n=1 Tax=Arthrobacter sp. AFG20 TaxID=1688671 RepID=UPI000C9EAC03|nr:hypothetical protein [Arthrobacter sp. AFG20]PNH79051.1 hypothetical protein CXZ05_20915 [Arthrobacter sp. AFG20]
MEDPTTIALNLTFFGTLGVAFLMFVGLCISVMLTLVIAGLGRLVALIVMALIGRLPKNETIEIVRLAADGSPLPAEAETVPAKAKAKKAPKPPRPVREPRAPIDWKKLRTRAGLQEALRSAVIHHPLVIAARPVPPVLAKDWADAVAAADARAVARARAATPEVKVTVRDLPPPDVAAASVTEVAPLVESALRHDAVPAKPATNKSASSKSATSKGETVRSALALSAQPPRPARKPAVAGHATVLDTGSMTSLAQHPDARTRA